MARFGNNSVIQSNWSPEGFAKMQNELVEKYPKVVQDIDQLVAEIARLVSELPAEQLLHRAWWEMAGKHINVVSETSVGTDEIVSIRMIDYIQSIIVSVPPAPNQRDEIMEDEWGILRAKVQKLFQQSNIVYQVSLTAKNRTDPDYNDDLEEFKFKAQSYWCNIRGRRYQVHEPAYLNDMFAPHSDVLKELFGITSEQFIEGVTRIWHNLTFGIQDAVHLFNQFKADVDDAVEAKLKELSPATPKERETFMDEVIKENGWEERRDEVFGKVFGLDLFDVEKVTNLPQALIEELTWSPGEEKEFFAAGQYSGWPLRIWPVFKRPFVRLNGRCCCFDLRSLFDNLYRVVQRVVVRLKPAYAETWKLKQQEQSETLPLKYLQQILPGASVWRSVYYPCPGSTGKKEWCEADAVLVYDDHLFIVECRGGAFTYTSPANDFPAYVKSLENLVLKPVTQGRRFLNYLNTADSVPLFDHQHQQIGQLARRDFRVVTICPVTLDPFTELAAQVQHLRKIGVNVGAHPVWAVSLDDLRVYADVFANPLIFLHFVEQRMRAFGSDIIQVNDELDHLGLYLEHNHYSLHAQQIRGDSQARLSFTGYTTEIDKFFYQRLLDSTAPCPLKQQIPLRLIAIIEFLARSTLQGRSRVASFLLDLAGEWRKTLADGIEAELARQPSTQRPMPMSTHGNVNVTVYCWTPFSLQYRNDRALAYARTVLLVNGEAERLMLDLDFDEHGSLREVSWQWIIREEIPAHLLPQLEVQAETLRQKRVAAAIAEQGRIGRNDPCPCGRGKKYKNCCLRKGGMHS